MTPQPTKTYRRILTGPSSIAAVDKLGLVKQAQKKYLWPYPWEFAPPGSVPVRAANDIAAPQINTLTQVLAYQVPAGSNFCLRGLVLSADVGAAWVPGSGDIIFSVTQNQPGSGNAQGFALKDFNAVYTPLGSLLGFPWPIPGTEQAIFEASTTLRAFVITTAAINPGAPNYIHAVLIGYTFPD